MDLTISNLQRRGHGANRWWEEQEKKHPDLDVEVSPSRVINHRLLF
jgi:hypothetical protein